MTPSTDYLEKCRELVHHAVDQANDISKAADWFAETILAGRMVFLCGAGYG